MRHISISIAIALSILLLVSICPAQQAATTSRQAATSTGNQEANTAKMGGGPDTIVNCVGAKNGTIPTAGAPLIRVFCGMSWEEHHASSQTRDRMLLQLQRPFLTILIGD